jgi:hypothetical protein
MIRNCPVADNITNAHAIFGPDLASIRGKMVWRTPAPVVADYLEVPRSIGGAEARFPAIVEADEDKVMYKIAFGLPHAGLGINAISPDEYVHDNACNDVPDVPIAAAAAAVNIITEQKKGGIKLN